MQSGDASSNARQGRDVNRLWSHNIQVNFLAVARIGSPGIHGIRRPDDYMNRTELGETIEVLLGWLGDGSGGMGVRYAHDTEVDW